MTNREYINTLSNYDFVRYIYDYVIPVIGKSYSDSRIGVAQWLEETRSKYDELWEKKNFEG